MAAKNPIDSVSDSNAATPQTQPDPIIGNLPLHIQISEMLVREIKAGMLANEERLPPERQMAERLQISVGTLRKSLADLESKGMLVRKHGSGNYVQNNPEVDNVYALFRLELCNGGGLPTAELVSIDTLKKPGSLPAFGKSKYAHRFRRLRRLNGTNAAVEEIWLDRSYVDSINSDEVTESLYLFYKEILGFWITRAEDRVSVATLPDWAPDGFFAANHSHYGYVERLSRDNNGMLAEYSRTWFDPQTVRFVAR